MIILGIDPSLRRTGYGVIRMLSPDRAEVLDCGIIAVRPDHAHSECLRRLIGGVRELTAVYHPENAAIEDAFYGKNIKTSMILSMARGAIIGTLAEAGVPVYAYSPRRAKKAVVGTGTATKGQVAAMMAARFRLDLSGIPDDATDALALALSHGQIAMAPTMAVLLPAPI